MCPNKSVRGAHNGLKNVGLENMPLELHCIGGFVICYFYGLPRTTADIDYYSVVPANLNLVDIAGEGSALANKYKIRLHHVAVMTMPERHETRLTEMFPGMFEQMRLFAP